MRYDYNAKQTSVIRRQILEDDAALVALGLQVTLMLVDRSGGLVRVSGRVDWEDASVGIARFTPQAEDLKAHRSPYKAQWWISDGTQSRPAPQGEPETWRVWP